MTTDSTAWLDDNVTRLCRNCGMTTTGWVEFKRHLRQCDSATYRQVAAAEQDLELHAQGLPPADVTAARTDVALVMAAEWDDITGESAAGEDHLGPGPRLSDEGIRFRDVE